MPTVSSGSASSRSAWVSGTKVGFDMPEPEVAPKPPPELPLSFELPAPPISLTLEGGFKEAVRSFLTFEGVINNSLLESAPQGQTLIINRFCKPL